MGTQTKKFPMCAEDIPLEATTCEYCGSLFEVTFQDDHLVSRFIGLASPAVSPPSVSSPGLPPAVTPVASMQTAPILKKKKPWLGWVIGCAVILPLLVVAGAFLFKDWIPLSIFPTTSPTRRPASTHVPTVTPNRTATQQRRYENATATELAIWVQGFAQPILDDVRGRRPNFEDDFSMQEGKYFRWSAAWTGVTFPDEVMRINTSGSEWVGSGGSLIAVDFVLEFDFTPGITSSNSTVGVNFRAGDPGWYNFCLDLEDEWCEMSTLSAGQDANTIADCTTSLVGPNRTTSVTIIAQGDRFAFFVNDQPVLYVLDPLYNGDWIDLGVYAPYNVAEVDFDNVMLWDLDNLKP